MALPLAEFLDLVEIQVIIELADRAGDTQVFGVLDSGEGPVHVFAERSAEEA
jgi:hypothetical protein